MTRPRAADDFATIRARMEELRQEREGGHASEGKLRSNPPLRQGGIERRPPREHRTGPDFFANLDQVRSEVETSAFDFGVSHSRRTSARR